MSTERKSLIITSLDLDSPLERGRREGRACGGRRESDGVSVGCGLGMAGVEWETGRARGVEWARRHRVEVGAWSKRLEVEWA